MAVDEGTLKVGGTIDLLDTAIVTQSDGSTKAHREAVVVSDPKDNDARQNIRQLDQFDEYGALVTDRKLVEVRLVLDEILETQKSMLRLMERVFEEGIY